MRDRRRLLEARLERTDAPCEIGVMPGPLGLDAERDEYGRALVLASRVRAEQDRPNAGPHARDVEAFAPCDHEVDLRVDRAMVGCSRPGCSVRKRDARASAVRVLVR